MHAAEGAQLCIVEALHPHRQPRDAGRAKAAEALALEGAWVGLEGDLAARLERQPRAHAGQQAVDAFRRHEARRAAADEDAVDAATPHERQRRLEVGEQRVEIARLGNLAALLVRIEVAVRALAQAPRHVHVQRERRQRAEVERAGAEVARDFIQGATPRASGRPFDKSRNTLTYDR